MSGADADRCRIDKWLWHARIFRSRSLAARFVAGGGARVNAVRVTRTAAQVSPGDTLTLALRSGVRVLTIRAVGGRRGPASEARLLYDEQPVAGGALVQAGPLQHPRPRPKPHRVE
ncbi:MAG: RNA-binding S4 domain-containing protein [Rhodobacteraceae bacterium]|nr:RNA-binding S4 domain-containing protein [Paracoccaceae bacterium]